MATLDFKKQRKKYLKLKLDDDHSTELSLLQPTKQLFDRMLEMGGEVSGMDGNDGEAIDEVYALCADLMSRNKEGIFVSKRDLEGLLDIEDVITFLQAYGDFVATAMHGKN